jgi:hypothetical protein
VDTTPARGPSGPANHARFTFLDDRSRDFWIDWERAADDAAAQLLTEAGRDPYDRALSDLVGELSTRNRTFRTRWAAHDVRLHQTGVKHVHHAVVGDLRLVRRHRQLCVAPWSSRATFVVCGVRDGWNWSGRLP